MLYLASNFNQQNALCIGQFNNASPCKHNFTLLNYLVHTMIILVMDTLTYKQMEK
jgi:hypothetical protein